ncbi:small ribosomal subunit protein uS7-like isoform X1 [Malania oleifera]|uniref:small ribosomal subunit protein uS7-like isoform X1 n=1 Tax=Malania oleifera TaxID=397392 RepID=UPI0025ADAAD0|nr:small ribosomal subunit protein uS7-like isoform X1 [Malania oleifera]
MADVAVGSALDLNESQVKLFNRWSFDDVQVSDLSLVDYIAVVPAKHATYVPHTAGRYSVKRFRKAQCPIVERLTNSLMMHGRNNGKKLMAVRIVKHAMEIIHLLTEQNPIQTIVDAVVNSGPREDATRIGSAGVVRRQAVDISPLRRVNQAIYLLTTGARESAFRNIKTIAECLADELINAAKGSSNRFFSGNTTIMLLLCHFFQRLFCSSPFPVQSAFLALLLFLPDNLSLCFSAMQSRRKTRLNELPRPTVEIVVD